MKKLVWAGIGFAAVSAACWLWSAMISGTIPLGGIGGTPPETIQALIFQGRLNAAAAFCAGLATACQAGASYLQMKFNAFQ